MAHKQIAFSYKGYDVYKAYVLSHKPTKGNPMGKEKLWWYEWVCDDDEPLVREKLWQMVTDDAIKNGIIGGKYGKTSSKNRQKKT